MLATQINVLLASLVLLAGVVDDIRSKKVHNKLIIVLLFLSLIFILTMFGFEGLLNSALSLVGVVVLSLPFLLLKIVGAGDVKLLMVFSLLVDWKLSLSTVLMSVVWGAVLGLAVVILKGQLFDLYSNILNILLLRQKKSNLQLHKIPYTVALLFGWASTYTLNKMGVSIW